MRRNVIDEWLISTELVALTHRRLQTGEVARGPYVQPETHTCCGKAKHGDKHTLLTPMWRRRLIVSGEGQEEAVINAHISASSAKHSAVNLTDDAAPPPLLLPPLLRLGRDADHNRTLRWLEPSLALSCKLCCSCGSDLFLSALNA